MKRPFYWLGLVAILASGVDFALPDPPRGAAPLKPGENLLERAVSARAAAKPAVVAREAPIALEAAPAALVTTRCYERDPGSTYWREVRCAD